MPKLYQKDNSRSLTILPKYQRNRRKSLKYWLRVYQRRLYLSFRNLKGNPITLARGLALGVFAGCFPFFGLQSIIGVVLATIFRGSKVAAIAGTWISNPLTYIPIYVFNFKVGKLLLGVETISSQEINLESISAFMELGSTFAIVLLTGCCVVGLILAPISYVVSLSVFKRLQRKKSRLRKKRSPHRKKPPVNLNK